jgi:hypothetical protein
MPYHLKGKKGSIGLTHLIALKTMIGRVIHLLIFILLVIGLILPANAGTAVQDDWEWTGP